MIEYVLLIFGLVLLVKGADYLVDGSSSLANKFGISALVIGLTIVAFGTSMPELIVNILAALDQNSSIALGNIVGSNIANILLILGISASIKRLKVQSSTIWKEIPFSLLAAIVLVVFANKGLTDNIESDYIYRFEGIILLLFFLIFLYYVFSMAKKDKILQKEFEKEIVDKSYSKIFILIFLGLVALYFGGILTVKGAIYIARNFGISEYIIGLTIVAVGTSLPELFTSAIAAMKNESDLAVGNVVGSNIFNIFFILGVTALIFPISLPAHINLDLLVLCATTLILFIFIFVGRKHELDRWQGIAFIIIYALYVFSLINRV